MLNVGFLTPSLLQGGAERWIHTLASSFELLRPAGVLLTTDKFDPRLVREFSGICPVFDREQVAEFSRAANIVISWGPAAGKMRGELAGQPIVEVSHASGEWEEQREMLADCAQHADYFVGVSETAAAAFPAGAEPVDVLYNGVDPRRVAPRRDRELVRNLLGVRENEKLLLVVGRFEPVKRPLLALEAFAALIDIEPDWKLIMLGDGRLRGDMERWLESPGRLAIADRVQLAWAGANIADYYSAADCLLVPSFFEGFPLVVAEAWLARLPVVMAQMQFAVDMRHKFGNHVLAMTEPKPADLAQAIFQRHVHVDVYQAARVAWENFTAQAFARRWETYLIDVFYQFSKERAGL